MPGEPGDDLHDVVSFVLDGDLAGLAVDEHDRAFGKIVGRPGVADDVGTPASRARIARCDSTEPVSATMPLSRGSSGPSPGDSVVVTSTDPVGGSSASYVTGPLPMPPPAPVPPPTSWHTAPDRLAEVGQLEPGREAARRSRGRGLDTRAGTTTARLVATASTCSSVMWRMSSGSVRSPEQRRAARRAPTRPGPTAPAPSARGAGAPRGGCRCRRSSGSPSRAWTAVASLGQDSAPGDPGAVERQHGRAPGEDLLVGQAVLSGLDEHAQRHRRAGHAVAAGVGEHAHEDLVGVQRTQDDAGRGATARCSCRLVRSSSAGTASRSASVRSSRCSASRGKRGAQPPDPPRAAQAADGGDRVQLVSDAALGLDLAREPQIDGDVPVDGTTTSLASTRPGWRPRPGARPRRRPREAGGPRGRAPAR